MPLIESASYNDCLSLLRASAALSCSIIREPVQAKVVARWASEVPPTAADTPPPYSDAIEAVELASHLEILGVIKRASYELLASEAFWTDARSGNIAPTSLLSHKLGRFYHARAMLQQAWRAHVLTLPQNGDRTCLRSCACSDPSTMHTGVATWCATFAQDMVEEVRDPLRAIDGMSMRVRALKDTAIWCESCIDERADAWEKERTAWWTGLDEWLL